MESCQWVAGKMKKVYFAITVAGQRDNLENGKEIVKILKENFKFNVLTEHLVDENAWQHDSQFTPQHVFERDMKWVDEANCLIAEISSSSLGVGYEIGYALNHKKPVLCLIKTEIEDKLSRIIKGNTSSYIRVVSYKNINEIEKIIRTFVQEFNLGE